MDDKEFDAAVIIEEPDEFDEAEKECENEFGTNQSAFSKSERQLKPITHELISEALTSLINDDCLSEESHKAFHRVAQAANDAPRALCKSGFPLPTPTEVSGALHSDKDAHDDRTIMVMQFGQFIDHDISLTPVTEAKGGALKCCGPNASYPGRARHRECFPIKMSTGKFYGHCMEFTRSVPAKDVNGRLMVPRQQVNELTSFVDGSMIYGTSEAAQDELRYSNPFARAYLRMSKPHELLPKAVNPSCITRPGDYCFLAGDPRVNEHPGLVVMHTVWAKLHNAIASRLQKFRGADLQDELFHITRKIVVAILQHILYEEWLPLVLGKRVMSLYKLWSGKRMSYDYTVDPRIFNAFPTAAFRFGHSLIPRHFVIKGDEHNLRKLFHRPDMVFDNFTGILESFAIPSNGHLGAQRIDAFIVDEVTAHLFEPEEQAKHGPSHGLDLAALNIQRGRDHGLPPFNAFRTFCGFPPFTSFDEFGPDMGHRLRNVYESVDDIDLFSGGLAEPPEELGCLGPTFGCLVATQFHALKYGDRFFYETSDESVGFTNAQLDAIRRVTMAHVLCSYTSDDEFYSGNALKEVQKYVFMVPSKNNPLRSCEKLRKEFTDPLKMWHVKYDRKYENHDNKRSTSSEEKGGCSRKTFLDFFNKKHKQH